MTEEEAKYFAAGVVGYFKGQWNPYHLMHYKGELWQRGWDIAKELNSEPPCNLPFERIPQHAADPGFGPVPPRPKVVELHQEPSRFAAGEHEAKEKP
jgi:hypothetical protein